MSKPTKSLLQDYEEQPWCYECGRTYGLTEHHCLFGRGVRKLAEKYGLKVLLCFIHHGKKGKEDVHEGNIELKEKLQQLAQTEFEKLYGHEKYMKIFGTNYL